MTDIPKTIISRIQQRRGLKQDLPQPLRPGEFGFATDTNQLYIGADPVEYYNDFNKISRLENVAGAALELNSITTNKLVKFQVPFYQFTVNTPNTLSFSWLANTASVFGTRSNVNLYSNNKFTAATVSVFKTGNRQLGDTTEPFSGNVALTKDFKFDGNLSLTNHQIKFRTAPDVGDIITVCYYNKDAILDAITEPGNITLPSISTKKGFYDDKNIPPSLYLDPELVAVSDTSGLGFIGVEDKHLLPFTYGQATATTGINVSNLIVESSTIPGVNATISLGNVVTLANLISVVNAANTIIKLEKDLTNTVYVTMNMANSNVVTSPAANASFVLRPSGNTLTVLGLTANSTYTQNTSSVKSLLESWLADCVSDANLNIVTSATVAQSLSASTINVDVNMYQVDPLAEPIELTHATKEETQAFNQVVNGIYVLQNITTNRTGIVNIKTNIEVPTELNAGGSTAGTTYLSPYAALISPGLGVVPGFSLPTDPYDTYIVEYSVAVQSGNPATGNYQRVGTMMLSGRSNLNGVAFTDNSTEINQFSGGLTFSASMVGTNIVLTAFSTLPPVTFRYIYRRWDSI